MTSSTEHRRPDVRTVVLRRPFSFESPFGAAPHALLVAALDPSITQQERAALSTAIAASGCGWAVCAGHECSAWDDAIDWAHLSRYQFDPPEDASLVTTWHTDDPPADVVDFLLDLTSDGHAPFDKFVVAFVGDGADRAAYEARLREREVI